MTGSWPGRYVDGLTAAVHEVVVTVDDGALVGTARALPDASTEGGPERGTAVATELGTEGALEHRAPEHGMPDGTARALEAGALFRWPASALACEELEAGAVKLTCRGASDASLVTDGRVAWILGLRGARVPDAAGTRGRRRRLTLAFGLGIVGLAGAFYVSLTPLARVISAHVPPGVEASLGHGLAAVIETQYCETEAGRAAAEVLARRLGAPAGTELHILDTDTVNAFTFPGGVVILTRGLLADAKDPDEIAGVLAHELEHVSLRHVMIRFVRTSMMTALWQASVGDYSGLFVIDPKTALDVASLRFTRDDERDADQGALERLDAAHVSREGFAAFFERLRAKTDVVPAWMSSHPASAERIARIRQGTAGAGAGGAGTSPALSSADWAALADGCRRK